ncbi:hypothetical protein CKO15_03560 [Halorhodospira abdelmalekii]|uniref:protein-disulfide reductase DsbD n=1 Tax=Halorhodospira abdelmalekii TaxID=421629 RepID=UPI00190360EE|nr:protein-disulfide reductase DsbD [Halorhodospira abdelmalekii]MBK1734376.1 hypothetical protein [Halorhodospira abdelmalekii]
MTRTLLVVLLSALLLLTSATASAGLKPVEEAFPFQIEQIAENRLVATWQIAPDHYLYRHALDFSLEDGDNEITDVTIPEGEKHHDEFFGEVQIYRDFLQVHIETSQPLSESALLRAEFQGCNEPRALCYPPSVAEARLDDPSTVTVSGGRGPGSGGSDPLTGLLAGGSLWAVLGGFFLAGLALAFTACLYPMIPILSGLIVGAGRAGERPGTGRALWLSFVYVQAVAITYAGAGALAGLSGRAIQADLQGPLVTGLFSTLFVLLALAMFGLYNLQVPAALQSRLQNASSRLPGGQVAGVAAMGVLSTLIVGACSGPALVAALAFIGNTGEVALGAGALYVMALGMGAPLLLVGTAAGRWMPRSGPWMEAVKQAFGFVFLGVALWMAARFMPSWLELLAWGLLLLAAAGWLAWRLRRAQPPTAEATPRPATPGATPRVLGWSLTALIALAGGAQLLGAATGASDPLRPWAVLTGDDRAQARAQVLAEWQTLHGGEPALREALSAAAAEGRPAIVEITADWCVYCIQLEERTLPAQQVREALEGVEKLRVDITAMSAEDQELLRVREAYLPPAILFFDASGEELRDYRIAGFKGPDEFAEQARAAFER